jgi:tetratricopeptide (TPR) repeat protein
MIKNQQKKTTPKQTTPTTARVKKEEKSIFSNPRIIAGIVLFITFLAFVPSLKNDFIDTWDDGVYVTENALIKQFSVDNFKSFFTTPLNGTYVPIPLITFAIEYKLFNLNPLPYHINNLILHLLCTLLVFVFLRKLKLPVIWAAAGMLFFGIHPMRVESVAWVTERKDLLFSVFYLASLITYINYVRNEDNKTRNIILTSLFFILSLFSKIQAVTLPLSLLLIDYYLERPLKIRLLMEKIPYFILSLGFGIAGFFILKKVGSFVVNEHFTLFDRLMFGQYALSTYLVKLVAPFHMSAFYPYPIHPGGSLPIVYYLSPLLLLLVAFLVYKTARHNRAVTFGALFFLFNVMFLLQILGAGQAFLADRFTYIPYLGWFFLLGWAGDHYLPKLRDWKVMIVAGFGILSLVYFVTTYDRCHDWKNTETLWTDVIEKYPNTIPDAYANRGSFYRKNKDWDKALADYNYAVNLDSTNISARMNRGNIFFDTGRDSLALMDYNYVLKNKSDNPRLFSNLGAIYGRKGIYDTALVYLGKSISLDSLSANPYLNRGLTYEKLNRYQDAMKDYLVYLKYEQNNDAVYSSVGICNQALLKYKESISWFDKAISMKPQEGIYFLNRSYSYYALKEIEKAKADAQNAQQLGVQVANEYLVLLK